MAASNREEFSIVEYLGGNEGHRCGYCGNSDTNLSRGFWAHTLTVRDYQDLIDRGWRRSGKYCYKSTMNRTCCPHYTIKQEALNFRISGSQKKVIKMVHRYLNDGKKPGEGGTSGTGAGASSSNEMSRKMKAESESKEKVAKPIAGPDPNKPPCKKAKVIRQERRMQKLAKKGESQQTKVKVAKETNQPKSLEDLLGEIKENPAHRLEIKLVRSSPRSDEFNRTFAHSYAVYKKYQMVIHKDPPHKPSESQFTRFLVDSPLQNCQKLGDSSHGYGTFHQQYWLDGQIFMVGVIDILPNCMSSVYLYYDPDFAFLSPGTYSALREIAFTRSLHEKDPDLKYYYMGYYIHSCAKMRYKGQYEPSLLLCPEVYTWHPITECKPKLDANKYSRFAEEGKDDENAVSDYGQVLVLYERQPMPYAIYSAIKPNNEEAKVREYADLVGKKCAERMLLYRN